MKELVSSVALQAVATGLGDLLPRVVCVGGATISLYASRAAAPARPTNDVDCIIELASYGAYALLEDRLRARRFRNDIESTVQVRWMYEEMQVDIMPTPSSLPLR